MDLREILCDLVNRCIIEINDGDDIKQPIKEKILKPLINYILEQIYPYLIFSVCIFALTLFNRLTGSFGFSCFSFTAH
jgi:hypothetical protein